jgi:ElaB/YqjD/DUF883 family membrane-anchored ribosome-binding protein
MADQTPRNRDDELTAEIANLKRELANLRAALGERASDIAQGASRAAEVVVQPIRNNPGTAGILFGGLIGVLVGLAIGQSLAMQQPRRWHDRYW